MYSVVFAWVAGWAIMVDIIALDRLGKVTEKRKKVLWARWKTYRNDGM